MLLFAGRLIIVSNHLPLRVKRGASSWEFEWDEDALVGQAKASELLWTREVTGRSMAERLAPLLCRRACRLTLRSCTLDRFQWTWRWRSRT